MRQLKGVVAFLVVMLHYWLTAPMESWRRAAFTYHINVCPHCRAKVLKLIAERKAEGA